jgi:hypothetical protein
MRTQFQRRETAERPFTRALIATFAVFTLLLFTFATAVQAQVLYGSLTGNVTDPSGAVVAGAKVEALNTLNGVTQRTITDPNGVYRLQNLQTGKYKVTISASGFATAVQDNIAVTGNTIKRADTQLTVASAQDVITVTAEQQNLQTDKADVHTDLSTQQIENLPVMGSQGRNFQSLLRIIPGAGLTAETNSLAGNPQRAINANINGQSNQSVNTRLDGAQDAIPGCRPTLPMSPRPTPSIP